MHNYQVTLNETVARDYIVEAKSEQEARKLVEDMYMNDEGNYGETFTQWEFVETEQIGNWIWKNYL